MSAVEFVVEGSDMNQGIYFASKLTANVFLNKDNLFNFNYIDIRCVSAEDAEALDEIMWSIPKNILLPHNLLHIKDDKSIINIGYPGGKFIKKDNKVLINLNPNLPRQIHIYKKIYQLVIEDDAELRSSAANSWKKCKKLGIKAIFNDRYEKEF